MRKGIIITLPASDDVTEYLYVFSREIIESCSENQVPIKQIEKEKVTKENVENVLKNFDYKLIIFNGHGSPKNILGHKNEEIICINKNEFLLKDRIIYARSCWSVAELGKRCVEISKESCFIGYKIPFMFIIDITRTTNPIKDNTAKIFFITSNLIPLGLIKGHTAQESHQNSRKSMLKSINKALSKGDKDSQAIAQALWNNYLGQDLLGNKEATL